MKASMKDERLVHKEPRLIYENGRPVEVILNIDDYGRLLEALEDREDLAYLETLKTEPKSFQSFEDFMKESFPGV